MTLFSVPWMAFLVTLVLSMGFMMVVMGSWKGTMWREMQRKLRDCWLCCWSWWDGLRRSDDGSRPVRVKRAICSSAHPPEMSAALCTSDERCPLQSEHVERGEESGSSSCRLGSVEDGRRAT